MELLWLEDFLSLARTGSFSKSATERHVTQSGFSRRIQTLEAWIGVPLIDRRTFPATLTPAGLTFRKTASNIVSELYHNRSELQGKYVTNKTEVSISAATTLLIRFIPQWLSSINDQLGGFTTTLKTHNFHEMAQSLADGDSDFVLQYFHPEVPLLFEPNTFDSMTLIEERFIPVTATDKEGKPLYFLPGKKDSRLPYMGYSVDSYLADVESVIFEANQNKMPCMRQCNVSPIAEVLKVFVMDKQGVAWLPKSFARSELESGLLVPAGGPEWETRLQVRIYRSRKQVNSIAKDIWRHIKKSNIPK